jgi:hypothetical protein
MRELTNKIMKSIFRIAICSIGGILIILGILLGFGTLLQIPEDVSNMTYVLLAVLILSIGLSLCFLVIKPMRYFVKSRKMSKEEKVIHNIKIYMRKGKSRIAVFTFLLMLMVSTLILIILQENKLTSTITPENTRLTTLVKLIVNEWHFTLFTGFFIAMLIIEISGLIRDKHRLTLNMWERIKELEKEVKGLKAGTQVESQQISDVDGGDSTSGPG